MTMLMCTTCFRALRVIHDPNEADSLLSDVPNACPWCSSPTVQSIEEASLSAADLAKVRITDVTAIEAFQILMGEPLPEDGVASFDRVQQLLTAKKIVGVRGFNVPGSTRSVITCLVLDDHTFIYLASSTHGAVVYRIANPPRFTSEVLHGDGVT